MDYMVVPEGAIWCSTLPSAQKLHSICSQVISGAPVSTLWQRLHVFGCSHVFCHVWSCRVWVMRQQDWTATEEPKDPWNILIYVWGSIQPTGDCPFFGTQNELKAYVTRFLKDFLTKAHQYLPAAPQSLRCLLEENDTVLSVSWMYSSRIISICI